MDAIRATAAAATTSTDTTTSSTGAATTTAATEAKKSFATLFAAAKADLKSGEKLTKVDGHEFARIKGGTRDDQCINLSGNVRNGQAFDLIWRNGHQFHVYGGKGAEHKVVEVGKKAATTTTDATSTTTPAATTTDTTSGGTASTGTTTTAADATTTSSDSSTSKS